MWNVTRMEVENRRVTEVTLPDMGNEPRIRKKKKLISLQSLKTSLCACVSFNSPFSYFQPKAYAKPMAWWWILVCVLTFGNVSGKIKKC